MWDIVCIASGLAFFGIAVLYTEGCARLGTAKGGR